MIRPTITRRQDLGLSAFSQQEVDDIQETFEVTILEIVTDGDKRGWDAGRDTHSVLNIEILKLALKLKVREKKKRRTASIPASLALCGLDPPSRVCNVNVVPTRSVRCARKKV